MSHSFDLHKFVLLLIDGPDQVTITPQAPPQFIKSGSDFNLTCSSVSSPAATFHWFHDQKLMENSGPVLTLKKIQEHKFGSKAGEYTCGASNDKTKRAVASAAVSLAVIGESPNKYCAVNQLEKIRFIIHRWCIGSGRGCAGRWCAGAGRLCVGAGRWGVGAVYWCVGALACCRWPLVRCPWPAFICDCSGLLLFVKQKNNQQKLQHAPEMMSCLNRKYLDVGFKLSTFLCV